ncbi:hypothetical protein D9615_000897 [Tricholomella constricta]|uniref:Uncharacterized protein n=1 Tax=Tricholomella constricta TaxID=117010 RepID=A0A8H5HL74_9AGAR|nr:hypothetical protein D9615_000897 [Tricholomella constricta]
MKSTTEGRDGAVERELSNHQRGIVDTCFEEGQFESAIALMEQLRTSNAKPAVSHVRQLIYIALQPEHPPAVKEMASTDVPSSPSKAALKKGIPSGPAVHAARRLLSSYAITNLPATIARALPCYEDPRKDQGPHNLDGSLESVIGPQSMCIPMAKSCWHILTEDFTQHGPSYSLPSGKGKKRAHHSDSADEAITGNAVVGPDAWPVLDWLLLLFEQDEMLTAACGSGRFSDLLLQQIPCPRSDSGPRWDTEVPLRIVFYCLEEEDLRRQALGTRLMTLLINLSYAGLLDLPIFVSSVYSRLTATELEKLPALFSGLSPSLAVHRFKVLLCQKLLTDSRHATHREARPQPQIRAQPRALRQTRTESSMKSISDESVKPPTSSAQLNKTTMPGYAEIQRLVEMKVSPFSANVSSSFVLRIKFELLTSYGMLQSAASSAEKDAEWLAALRGGRIAHTSDLAFGSDDLEGGESGAFRTTFQSILSTW